MTVADQLGAQLNTSKRRFMQLELDAEKEALAITQSQSLQINKNEQLKAEIKVIDTSILGLRRELQEIIHEASRVSGLFHEIIKEEHLKALDQRIDKWPLEEFITREEFEVLLTKRLSNS